MSACVNLLVESMTNMTQEINAIDRIMLILANNIAKQAGLPEFYAAHIHTPPNEERCLVEAVKKQFTLRVVGTSWMLIPLKRGKA